MHYSGAYAAFRCVCVCVGGGGGQEVKSRQIWGFRGHFRKSVARGGGAFQIIIYKYPTSSGGLTVGGRAEKKKEKEDEKVKEKLTKEKERLRMRHEGDE